MIPYKSRPAPCSWCHRTLWLLPEGVCGACIEEVDYVDHIGRMERTERINNRIKEAKYDSLKAEKQ